MSQGPQTIEQIIARLRWMIKRASAKDKVTLKEAVAAILELGLRNVELQRANTQMSELLSRDVKQRAPHVEQTPSPGAGVPGLTVHSLTIDHPETGELVTIDEEARLP